MNTTEIINSLISADPSLASQRDLLEKLIPELIASRPVAEITDSFRITLKQRLVEEQQSIVPASTGSKLRSTFIRYSAYGSACLALILITAGGAYFSRHNTTEPPTTPLSIHQVGDKAFGALSFSGSGSGKSTASSSGSMAINPNAADSTSVITPYPIWSSNPYTIAQPVIDSLPKSVEVFKQLPTSEGVAALFSTLLPTGNAMRNVTNYSLRTGDYLIQTDLTTGTISIESINQSIATPLIHSGATSSSDPAMPSFVTPSPTPISPISDEDALNIAAAFTQKIGIATGYFGTPEVIKPPTTAVEPLYYPMYSTTTVVYPLTISGLPVVDQSGTPVGITIQINPQDRTVSYANISTTFQFERSVYPVNAETFKKSVQSNNSNTYSLYDGAPTDTTTPTPITLKDPTLVLMLFTQNSSTTNQTESYLVPSYSFANPSQNSYPAKIVVPLPDLSQ